MYLTYEEYVAFGGTLDATTFDDLEFEAEAIVNYYTFNRLKGDTTLPPELKRLMKYLVDLAQKKADSLSLGNGAGASAENVGVYITSQSNDGVSVTYSGMAATDLYKMCEAEADGAVNRYLSGVMNEAGRKLLYRGLYPGE